MVLKKTRENRIFRIEIFFVIFDRILFLLLSRSPFTPGRRPPPFSSTPLCPAPPASSLYPLAYGYHHAIE